MGQKAISETEARDSIKAVEAALKEGFREKGSPSVTQVAARMLGIETSTLGHRLKRAKLLYDLEPDWSLQTSVPVLGTAQIVAEMESQIHKLQTQVSQLSKDQVTRNAIRTQILDLKAYKPSPPRWLDSKKSRKLSGVPILMASDWQLGEVVEASEINEWNEFNLTVAEERVDIMMRKAIQRLFDDRADHRYPGIVFILGGDMVSGDSLHEDLTRTNEERVLPVVLRLFDLLVGCIDRLLERFDHVHVPCVPGNHGRLDRKPVSSERNVTNFDWFTGVLLERHYAERVKAGTLEKNRVTFQVENSPDAYFSVYGWRYCLTHGDQFRGGDGIIGPLGPVTRGRMKKQARDIIMDQAWDTLIVGHFHTLIMLRSLVINGSLPGYNSYAYLSNMTPEEPAQGMWLQSPDDGVTNKWPLVLKNEAMSQVPANYLKFKAPAND